MISILGGGMHDEFSTAAVWVFGIVIGRCTSVRRAKHSQSIPAGDEFNSRGRAKRRQRLIEATGDPTPLKGSDVISGSD